MFWLSGGTFCSRSLWLLSCSGFRVRVATVIRGLFGSYRVVGVAITFGSCSGFRVRVATVMRGLFGSYRAVGVAITFGSRRFT